MAVSKTKSAGRVGVQAVPITAGFAGELRRKLKVLEEQLKVKIDAEIDTSRLEATLNAFQDKYKVRVEAVLDSSNIDKGMARELGKVQKAQKQVEYSPDFDTRPWERRWKEIQKITDDAEKRLGRSERDMEKRAAISAKRQELERKTFMTPALTPESQSKHLGDLDKEIKKLRKEFDGEFELRVDYNEKSGKAALAKVDKVYNDAMARLGSSPEASAERDKLIADMREFNKLHKENIKLGALSNNYKGSAPAMDELIQRMEKTGVHVPVELDPIDALTIQRLKKEAQDRFGTLEANIDPKLNDSDAVRKKLQDQYKRAMNGIDGLEVHMLLGLSDEHARSDAERLVHDINGRSVELSVNANVLAASARLREFMDRPRTATIYVDADTKKAMAEMKAMMASLSGITTVNRQFERFQNLLTNASTIIPKLAVGSSVVGGIGAAAISSVAGIASLLKSMEKLLGVAGMIPAAATGIAVMGVTLVSAFNGIGGAVARLAEDKAGGGGVVRNAKVQAIQIAQAQRRIETAHENAADAVVRADERIIETQTAVKDAVLEQGQDRIRSAKAVRDAQRELDDANKASTKIEENVTKAREKAVKSFVDLQRKLDNAVLSRRNSEIEYSKALQAYESASTDTSRSTSDMTELELARDKAAQQLKDAKTDEKDLKKERNNALTAGVTGAEDYVKALDEVENSQERIRRAEEALDYARSENSTNAVKYAGRVRNAILDEERARKSADDTRRTSQRAILEAEEAMYMLEAQRTDTASRAADAMAALTPQGRKAAEAFLHVREVLSDVRQIVQENFFKGFTDPMTRLIDSLLPQLKSGFGGVATVMGSGWGTFFDALNKGLSGGVLERILNNIATAIANGNKAIAPFVQAFIDLTDVGSTLLPGIMTTWAEWANTFSKFIDDAKNDGSLKKWMEDGINGFKELGRILKGAYGIFTAIAGAAAKAGGMNMGSLGDSLNKTAEFMKDKQFQDALTHVFKGADIAMQGIEKGMVAFGKVFVDNGPAIEKIIGSLGKNLGKIMELVSKVLGDPKTLAGIQEFLDGIGKGIGKLIEAAPEISAVMGTLFGIGGKLAELFGTVWAEVYKFVAPFAEFLGPILKFLIDIAIAIAPFVAWIIPVGKLGFVFKLFGGILGKVSLFFAELGTKSNATGKILDGIGKIIGKIFPDLGKFISEIGPNISKWFSDLTSGASKWLADVGPKVVQGFIDGFNKFLPQAKGAVGWFMDQVNRFFPHSPALEGAFSGKGWTLYSGASLAQGFADGISSAAGNAKNAVGGLMSGVKVGFDGAVRGVENFTRDFLNNLGFNGDELINSGKSLMRGLGEGVQKVAPQLYKTIQGVMANVRKYFPFSPAKIGPFSGSGYTTYSGRALATDFAKGISSQYQVVSRAALGLVSAVEMPKNISLPAATMDAVTGSALGATESLRSLDITNNIYETVSARATALETTRLQKAKVA